MKKNKEKVNKNFQTVNEEITHYNALLEKMRNIISKRKIKLFEYN